MRRQTKKQITELLHTLRTANEILLKIVIQEKPEETVQLLTDAQSAAISIGNKVESAEGEGCTAVHCMEAYCEDAWQCSQEMDNQKKEEIVKRMDATLDEFEDELEQIQIQYEIAFLPYKASMWDSLESIWRAAEQDPQCDTYVIPIPFFERPKPEAQLSFRYEGNLFPEYVPVTLYEDYDFNGHHPDIIYIHNPYDNENIVTSVHPDFYSEKLRGYTDKLVYVPYFFTGAGFPEAQLTLSSYKNMDYIVIQSEKVAAELAQYIPEKKLLSLGTPKVDRLIAMDRKHPKLPEEWKRIIADKKVILLNISVSGILKNSKYVLQKIKYVISKFENRTDVILWWRPHPLIEATLSSMRADLYTEYMDIKNRFIETGLGILDETADVTRAVVMADGYLGEDTSSIIHYFGVLGKPAFVIDWELTQEWTGQDKSILTFSSCFREENHLWFCTGGVYGNEYLYRMNLETGEIEIIKKLPGMKSGSNCHGGMYYGIAKYGEKVILTPAAADEIYIYNLKLNQTIKIPLAEQCKGLKFDGVYMVEQYAILKPRFYSAIVKVNMETYECSYLREQLKPIIPSITIGAKEQYFMMAAATKEQDVYIVSPADGKVLIYNALTDKTEIKELGTSINGFTYMTIDHDNMWLIRGDGGAIIRWDMKQECICEYDEFPNGFSGGVYPFRIPIDCGDKIITMRGFGNMDIQIDKATGNLKQFNTNYSYEEQTENRMYCDFPCIYAFDYDNRVYSISGRDKSVIIFDMDGKYVKSYELRIAEKDRGHIVGEYMLNMYRYRQTLQMNETEYAGIDSFISGILALEGRLDNSEYRRYITNMDGSAGAQIHEAIMNTEA